jgi:prepilin-type N-terminal cleavage/methylation domain-containing protein
MLSSRRAIARSSDRGFTLYEMLIVMAIIGILSTISGVVWLSVLDNQRLKTAQSGVLQMMRKAQIRARSNKEVWEACIRQQGNVVQAAASQRDRSASQPCAEASWETLAPPGTVTIDTDNSTLYDKNGIYRVQFKHRGEVNGRLGRITFTVPNRDEDTPKRCVFVSTLLGALRQVADEKCER